MKNKLYYVLQLADNAVIMGQRLGEWCGHGPVLEQDIALTNTSLDHIGRARSLYQYAAELFNNLPPAEKAECFLSVALTQKAKSGVKVEEDDMAFLRDAWDYRNFLLVEQPNRDWAYTIARNFFVDAFNYFYYAALCKSSDSTLSAIAEKSLKEITYHLKWSSEWIIRLGDGTDESHARIQEAVNYLWSYTGEMFSLNAVQKDMIATSVAPDTAGIQQSWKARIAAVLAEAKLDMPTGTFSHAGGIDGTHTEHLGYILADLQFMQRTYPDMAW